MSKSRKKLGRKGELRKEITQLGYAIGILHHRWLDAAEKLHRLETKPKRRRKRPSKCQSSAERVPAFRLPDTVPAAPLHELHH